MSEDPMLSQSEIDALLRSMTDAPEAAPEEQAPTAEPVEQSAFHRTPRALPEGFDLLLGVEVTCSVDLGEVGLELGELLSLGRSSLLVLGGSLDSPLVLRVNGVPFAYGNVVEADGRYGLRIMELAQAQEEADAS